MSIRKLAAVTAICVSMAGAANAATQGPFGGCGSIFGSGSTSCGQAPSFSAFLAAFGQGGQVNGPAIGSFLAALLGKQFGSGPTAPSTAGGSSTFSGPSTPITQVVTNDTPSAVPLPAAGWMLLAGVGGLALVRRRKAEEQV